VASRWLGWFWIQGFVVCTVAVSLCRPPCYPVQDRSLDGAGPLPAWHQPSANEFIPPAVAVLCHPPHCVSSASPASGSSAHSSATQRAEKKQRVESGRDRRLQPFTDLCLE
jgi:hypothetical protein